MNIVAITGRRLPNSVRSQPALIWARLKQNKTGMAGLIIVIAFLLIAFSAWTGLLGQEWSQVTGRGWEAPSAEHPLGTNRLGQDVMERAIYSTRTAFKVGLLVSVLSTALGAILGALAGWFGQSFIDEVVLWLKGVLDSIPFYLFVAAVAFAMKGNPWANGEILLLKIYLYASFIYMLRRTWVSWTGAAFITAFLLLIISLLQIIFGNHNGEFTEPLIAVLIAWAISQVEKVATEERAMVLK